MSGYSLLDGAALAVSLFNTFLLLWLGLTLLLDTRQKNFGVWLAGTGLLLGAAFFISHSAILSKGLYIEVSSLNFWWHVGWAPVVLSPFAWYLVILWYTGYWDTPSSPLRRRQSPWFVLILVMTVVLIGLFLFANPLPLFNQPPLINIGNTPTLWGVSWLAYSYPVYILLCIMLAMDALLRPGPTGRLSGDEARRRARPWLVASTLMLLMVSLMVAVALAYIVSHLQTLWMTNAYIPMGTTLAEFDLAIASLLAIAILLIGQAVVTYEVFTGRVLPRDGLKKTWTRAILLALGISLFSASILSVGLSPAYALILVVGASAGFYASFTSSTLRQYEQSINRMKPFLSSAHLYEGILAASQPQDPEENILPSFHILCAEILRVKKAFLAPQGALSSVIPFPLVYPLSCEVLSLDQILNITKNLTPKEGMITLEPEAYREFVWAVPVRAEGDSGGILFLGPKMDRGFFTQEEIDLARASAERFLDLLAGAELSRRLVELQRKRMAESQIIDRRTRRVLHDEILPKLHTALLTLSAHGNLPENQEAVTLLTGAHRQISNFLREIPVDIPPAIARQGLFSALRQEVEQEYAQSFDQMNWSIDPQAEATARSLPSLSAETLFFAAREAVRNAARHARPPESTPPLSLSITAHAGSAIRIIIEDNGVGLPATQGTGGGQGLTLHSTLVAILGGSLVVESIPGEYTRITINLPVSS